MTTKKIFNLSLTNGRSHEQSILMDGSGGGSNPPSFNKTENYFDQKHRYVENACGTKNIQRVNLRTGKLSVTQYVYGVNGRRLPFNLSLGYNPTFESQTEVFNDSSSDYTHGKLIAKGWKFNYQQYIREQSGKFYYYDENFNLHVFEQAQNSTSVYYDKSGQTGLTLYEIETGYEIDDGKNTKLQFNARGELVKIIHKKGSIASELTITYNSSNLIASITDGAGRTFTFEYDESAKTVSLMHASSVIVTLKINESNQLYEVYYAMESGTIRFSYDYRYRLYQIDNYLEKEGTSINYTEDSAIFSLSNYKKEEPNDVQKTSVALYYYTKKSTVHNTLYVEKENGAMEQIVEIKHYYFATNNELIYVVGNETTPRGEEGQTLDERAIEFLETNTFATAKEFKDFDVILQSKPIGSFKYNDSTQITVSGSSSIITQELEIPNVSESLQNGLLMIKIGPTIPENLNVNLYLDDNLQPQKTININNENVNAQTHFAFFTITSQEHLYKLEISNNSEETLTFEIDLYLSGKGEEKNVITQSNGTAFIEQTTANGTVYWYEVGKCAIEYDGGSISNVDFTFKDYLLTAISYLKNNSSFNVWYNDGKNLLTNCSASTLFKFGTSTIGENITELKYGTMQKTATEERFSYGIVNSSEFVLHNQIHRDGEFENTFTALDGYLRTGAQEDIHNLRTEYSYDNYGNVTKQEVYHISNTNNAITEDYTYINGDQLASKKNYRLHATYITSYSYDNLGNLTSIILRSGQVINYTNNFANQLTSISSTVANVENKNNLEYFLSTLSGFNANSGNGYTFGYDKFNNLKTVTQGNNTIYSQNTYYNSDNSGFVQITYGNGYVEKRYFDKYGHINKISEVVNGMESELFIFIYGDLTSPQIALNCIEAMYTLDNEYGLDISAKSKLLKIVDKRQEYTYNLQCDRYNCWIYYYDNVGNIKYVKEYKFGKVPHNVKVSNRDGYGRITQKDTYIGTDVGKLYYTTVKNIEYENKFSNDIISEETETGLSERASLKLNSSYTKDSFTRPTAVQVKDENNNGYRQEITYLTKGYRESMSGDLIGPTPSEPPYVATGETNIIDEVKTYGIVSGTETLEKTEKLSYDPNGNITRYGDNTYEYDGIGRLTRENNADLNRSYTYEYDSRGNVISKKEYAYTRITLGAVVSTQNYTYNGYDRLTNTGYVYDNLGNPTSYNGKTLTWKGNSLNSFTKSGITYELGYDWQRLLHCKTYTKNSKEIKEYYYYDGTRRTYDEIYYGNEVYPTALSYAYNKLGIAGFYLYDSQGDNTGSYTYRKNLFGDITAIYQGSTCVAKYKYDAWGNCTVCNPDGTANTSASFIGNINPFRYRGYYWDKDLQLYYLQTRWYDPIIGRFISPDSVEYLDPESFGGLNLYAYCLNNPIMYVDPSGCIPEWLEWTLLGVGVALSLAAITVGGFVTGGLLSSVLIGAGVGFLTGASTDIIYQGVENNWDFSQINISAALKTGAIDATIGAITGLFSFTIGQLGQQIGEYIGHTISNYKIFGRSIGQIYSYFGGTSMLMAVGGYVGGKIAGFVGASYGFYVANNAFGKQNTIEDTLNEGYKNLFHWIISIFM